MNAALERFKRDHATVDKQEREVKRQRDEAIREKRRIQSLGREQHHKDVEEQNVQKLMRRQSQSIQLHHMGSKLSIHSHGAAVDPVSQRYENTDKGRKQEQKDKDKRIDTLVRTHHLQTCGTSGYNIINGQSLQPIEELVGNCDYPQFQNKLSNYYEKFRIKLG